VTASTPRPVDWLAAEIADWPVSTAAVAVVDAAVDDGGRVAAGPIDRVLPWASVTKILTALLVLLDARDGVLDLDEPAGPPGATVRHLLAHASGLTWRGRTATVEPATLRVYSNSGYDVLGEHVTARTGEAFADRMRRRLLVPLGLTDTHLTGSAAGGATGPLTDLATLAAELLRPDRLPPELVRAATTCAYPGLAGHLPGFGHQDPNDWGLGPELRAAKAPHWTAPGNSPRTFGHFGQSGSFLWVDPEHGLACVSLSDRAFGPWAADRWPRLSARVLARP
jgi:CubicO group peptidase (beta-lactamase class C family)